MNRSDFVYATWLGTAGLYVSDGETSFFIDPYVSRSSVWNVLTGTRLSPDSKSIDKCISITAGQDAQAVLVGHSHFDHLMDAPEFAIRTGALLVGSESTANVCRGAGMPEEKIRVIKDRATFNIGSFCCTFIEGVHGRILLGRIPYPGFIEKPLALPARARDYRLGGFFSMIISHPLGTFIHHGSAGWITGMYEGVKADTIFLCLAGRKETDSYLRETVRSIGARCIIPIHHDAFFSPLENTMSLIKGVRLHGFISSALKIVPQTEVRFVPALRKFKLFC